MTEPIVDDEFGEASLKVVLYSKILIVPITPLKTSFGSQLQSSLPPRMTSSMHIQRLH